MPSIKAWRALATLIFIALPQAARADAFAYATTGSGKLYKLNLTQQTKQQIGASHPTILISALAFTDSGQLYGIADGVLYSIDTQTGVLTPLPNPNQLTDPDTGQHRDFFAMTFNRGTGLVGASSANNNTKSIYTIDPSTGALKPLPPLVTQIIEAITFQDSSKALVTTGNGYTLETLTLLPPSVMTPIATLPAQCYALAVGSDHNIYALGKSGQIFTITLPSSGPPAVTQIGVTGNSGTKDDEWLDMAAIPGPDFSNGAVLNAASLEPYVAPGSLATIFGAGFSDQPTAADSSGLDGLPAGQLPTTLAGVSLTIDGGLRAPIYFVGPNQIKFQVPYEARPGTAKLTLTNSAGSTSIAFTIYASAPGIFPGHVDAGALATDLLANRIDGFRPATAGEQVLIYVTGAGLLDTPVPTGAPAPPIPVSRPIVGLRVTVGGVRISPSSYQLAAGLIGIVQIQLTIPPFLSSGYQSISVEAECNGSPTCKPSNTMDLPLGSPAPIDFGNQGVGNPSDPMLLTFTNHSSGPIRVSAFITGPNSQDFLNIVASTCSGVLPAQSSCTFSVSFRPAAMGSRNGVLQIDEGYLQLLVPFVGTGVPPLTLSANSFAFDPQGVGSPSAPKILTITSNISQSVNLGVAIVSGNPADFAVSSTTCPSLIPSHGTCTISVQFTPTAIGARNAPMRVWSSILTQDVALTGTGVASFTMTPNVLVFGLQGLQSPSAPQTVTISNNGSFAAGYRVFPQGGANSSDFVISGTTCPFSIAPYSSCTISVQFRPTAMGTRNGVLGSEITPTMSLPFARLSDPPSVTVTGTGAPSIALAPNVIDFGSQPLASSTVQLVTVSNNESFATSPSGVGFGGSNAGDFAVSSTNCTSSISPHSSCTISVQLTPTAMGARNATLIGGNPLQNVTLTGIGTQVLTWAPDVVFAYPGQDKVVPVANNNNQAVPNRVSLGAYSFPDFSISATTCTPVMLAPQSSCTVTVRFTAAGPGTRRGTLTINSIAGVQVVNLTGTSPY